MNYNRPRKGSILTTLSIISIIVNFIVFTIIFVSIFAVIIIIITTGSPELQAPILLPGRPLECMSAGAAGNSEAVQTFLGLYRVV